MPTDYIVNWLTLPLGLVLISMAIALPFGIWRWVLGRDFSEVGMRPLVIGYIFALIGHVVANFVSSYLDFSSRVATGLLPESDRWPWLLYSTTYLSILFLLLVLPLLGLLGVPFAALLIRLRRLTYFNIFASAIGLWLILSTSLWYVEVNNTWGAMWEPAHPVETFINSLRGFLPGILFVAMPFLISIRLTSPVLIQGKAGETPNRL